MNNTINSRNVQNSFETINHAINTYRAQNDTKGFEVTLTVEDAPGTSLYVTDLLDDSITAFIRSEKGNIFPRTYSDNPPARLCGVIFRMDPVSKDIENSDNNVDLMKRILGRSRLVHKRDVLR